MLAVTVGPTATHALALTAVGVFTLFLEGGRIKFAETIIRVLVLAHDCASR
jgi:hypothetical protein